MKDLKIMKTKAKTSTINSSINYDKLNKPFENNLIIKGDLSVKDFELPGLIEFDSVVVEGCLFVSGTRVYKDDEPYLEQVPENIKVNDRMIFNKLS